MGDGGSYLAPAGKRIQSIGEAKPMPSLAAVRRMFALQGGRMLSIKVN